MMLGPDAARTAAVLLRVVLLAVGVQLAFMLASLPSRTELLYDLSGGVTFVAAFLLSFWAPGLWGSAEEAASARRDPLRVAATALACAWALRLSGFLFWRVVKLGSDARFDRYKAGPWTRFAAPWMAQAGWVTLVGLPVYLLNASRPSPETRTRGRRALFALGAVLFVLALATETVADLQKAAAKAARPADFVCSGLFRYVRYPQYASEMAVWGAAWLMCSAGLSRPWQVALAAASPATTFGLLRYVSGVPLAEAAARARYGRRADYAAYVARTPMFVPRVFG